MQAAQALKTLRSAQQTDEAHFAGTALLEPIDGSYRCIGGSDHGGDNYDEALTKIVRGLEEIFDRDKGFGLAVEADMGDAGGRHKVQHTLDEGGAGAQHGREHQLLAGYFSCRCPAHRRLDLDVGKGEIDRKSVA